MKLFSHPGLEGHYYIYNTFIDLPVLLGTFRANCAQNACILGQGMHRINKVIILSLPVCRKVVRKTHSVCA